MYDIVYGLEYVYLVQEVYVYSSMYGNVEFSIFRTNATCGDTICTRRVQMHLVYIVKKYIRQSFDV